MAQFLKPKIVFNGILRAGGGLACFREDFEVYTVDVTSAKIFDGPKPIVPHTTEYTTAAQRFVSSLSGFTKSTCIQTSDGVPIIWFIKQGMTSPWGHIGQFLFKATVSALQLLMSIYAPPRAIMGDPRHVWNFREEVARYEAQGRPYGVYHWAYWFAQGQPRPLVSAETHPRTIRRHDALIHYFFRARWMHIVVSKWLKTLDPEMWEKYWTCYQRLRSEGKLGELDDGDMGCFCCHVCLVNAVANPHRDNGDVMRGVVITCPSGPFKKGGEVGFLELGLRFDQKAGDLLIAPSAACIHLVMPHSDGDRYSDVWFTKELVLNPPDRPFYCNFHGCNETFIRENGCMHHQRIKKDAAHKNARARKAFEKVSVPNITFDQYFNTFVDPAEARVYCELLGCDKVDNGTTMGWGSKTGLLRHKLRKHPAPMTSIHRSIEVNESDERKDEEMEDVE